MALRNSKPLKFVGRSLSDAIESTHVPPGMMNQLVNLIPDPSTEGIWMCRPAVVGLVPGSPWSPGFSPGFGPLPTASVGYVTVQLVVGNRIYGMASTTAFGGSKDQPFCFDVPAGGTIGVANISGTTLPDSLLRTGDWVPPTMTLVGTKIVVCHQGFSAPNFVGYIDISNASVPVWTAGNLTGVGGTANPFVTPPTACGQFNGRAYYLVNPVGGAQPYVIFSDSLLPQQVTNSDQILNFGFGDNQALTATGGLGMLTTIGGIVQTLLVFKGVSGIYQITGDYANTPKDLKVDALNVATGTFAPRSITPTPQGLAFIAPDGLRFIDNFGNVSDPVGINGTGISVPFISALYPTRMAAAFGSNIYRVTVQNGVALNAPLQEFWYDQTNRRWSGPHTCTFSSISAMRNFFVGQLAGDTGVLARSDILQSAASTFVEGGAPMTFGWRCAMLPDTDRMAENSMVETTLMMSLNTGDLYTVTAIDQNNSAFDVLTLAAAGQSTVWGAFQWGQAVWGGAQSGLAPQQLAWSMPIVFRRLAIDVVGKSSGVLRIGALHLRYEELGYLQQTMAGA